MKNNEWSNNGVSVMKNNNEIIIVAKMKKNVRHQRIMKNDNNEINNEMK